MTVVLARFFRAIRHPQNAIAALQRRYRFANSGSDPELQQFWRDQGAQWISTEASDSEIQSFDRLAKQIASLSMTARRAVIVSAFKGAWSSAFLNSPDRIDWDIMQEHLPDVALVCFFEGALLSRQDRKSSRA